MLPAVLICSLLLMACGMEIDNSDETTADEYRAKIVNSRWQLSEILDQNNQWLVPADYNGLDIPELAFRLNNTYFMRICKSIDRQKVTYINGKYDISSDGINMTVDNYQGIAYSIKITSLSGNTLEGLFTDWGQEKQTTSTDGSTTSLYDAKHYTIRLKRTNQ